MAFQPWPACCRPGLEFCQQAVTLMQNLHAPSVGLSVGCQRDEFQYSDVGEYALQHWPSQQQWPRILREVSRSSMRPRDFADPSRVSRRAAYPIFSFARLAQYGMMMRLNNFANEMLVAMYLKRPIVLCAPAGVRDTWTVHFEDPGFLRSRDCDWPGAFAPNCSEIRPKAWLAGSWTSLQLAKNESFLAMKRFIYRGLFRFKPHLRDDETALLRDLDLVDVPFIGVHIRCGGDKAHEWLGMEVATYAKRVWTIARSLNITRIFVASDSSKAIQEMETSMGQEFRISSQLRLKDDLYAIRNRGNGGSASSSDVFLAERTFLLDVALLIRASVFVGTASSNVGRFIFFMRSSSKESVSLDDGGDFLRRHC
eukprot:TRINITY_DN64783_c0_g1_i1.p1 TRINITY_DN64783_c0_g1~~TRINITY_DN64783_c0_g1_i1.p1  ORF type:complete len:368 (-),score=34.46 TRINITY_DN64783_c0_g1_i1:411-1514(-)